MGSYIQDVRVSQRRRWHGKPPQDDMRRTLKGTRPEWEPSSVCFAGDQRLTDGDLSATVCCGPKIIIPVLVPNQLQQNCL